MPTPDDAALIAEARRDHEADRADVDGAAWCMCCQADDISSGTWPCLTASLAARLEAVLAERAVMETEPMRTDDAALIAEATERRHVLKGDKYAYDRSLLARLASRLEAALAERDALRAPPAPPRREPQGS